MINKITLIGNAGQDAVLKSAGADQYARFTLATNENYKDSSGQWQKSTEWHTIKIWGRTSEMAVQKIKSGVTVYIEGTLKSYEFEGRRIWEVKSIIWRALDKKEQYQDSSKLLGPEPSDESTSTWRAPQSQTVEPASPWGYPKQNTSPF